MVLFFLVLFACGLFRVALVHNDGKVRACPRVGHRVVRKDKRLPRVRFGSTNEGTLTGKPMSWLSISRSVRLT